MATGKRKYNSKSIGVTASDEYLKSANNTSYLKNILALTPEHIKYVCNESLGQRKNPFWLIARRFRLTASNFGIVLSAVKRNKFLDSIYKRLLGK